MAKAKAKKPTKDEPKFLLMDPEAIHKLLGMIGPYEPPEPPVPTKDYVFFWDFGMSINTLVKKKPELFYMPRSSRVSGAPRTRIRGGCMWGDPIEPNLPFADQEKKLKTGGQPAAVREIVMYLALHFLTTGEKLDFGPRTWPRRVNG